eukprot:a342070_11.p1 GENE.a342070_11~~a342070_11.p1  ORF type:complete len:553 (+),score=197.31 a342070_11:37-1659(+)
MADTSVELSSMDVVAAFKYLDEKSQQLFAGLRDLPQFGRLNWQPYFQKTFDVFTKLWQFQQQHRRELEGPDYGLQRWQLGEIASKIGQLFYHYYLRTSESSYLQESAVFYSAIRERGYFKDATTPERKIKRLRYQARFVVVAMLLPRSVDGSKWKLPELRAELAAFVADYSSGGGDDAAVPADAGEWSLVLRELDAFLDANARPKLSTLEGAAAAQALKDEPRLSALAFPPPVKSIDESPPDRAFIADAVLVEARSDAVKVSELSLDTFRLVQALEYAPEGLPPGRNPHKYLLYRPTVPQLLVFLATALKESPGGAGVLVVYLSAESGGEASLQLHARASAHEPAGTNLLCAHDLSPLARRPLFVIIDSELGSEFGAPESRLGLPVVVLCGARQVPADVRSRAVSGSLLSHFLADPLVAFQTIAGAGAVAPETWLDARDAVDRILATISELLRLPETPREIAFMLDDPFLGRMVTRFAFFQAVVSVHSSFAGDERAHPTMIPPLPHAVTESNEVLGGVLALAGLFSVALKFENVTLSHRL